MSRDLSDLLRLVRNIYLWNTLEAKEWEPLVSCATHHYCHITST